MTERTIDGFDGRRLRSDALRGRSAPLLFAALALWLALTAAHHEIGHEEAQAWNISRAAQSPLDTLELGRFEGHTPFWHLVLWGPSRSGTPLAMQALGIALTLAGVALLLRDRPFPLAICALVPFGYFVVFEYSVVARTYVLALALSMLLASLLYRERRRDPVLVATLCGLIGFTSAYGLLISLPLLVASASVASSPSRGRLALGGAIYAAFALAAVWFIVTPFASHPDEAELVGGARAGRVETLELLRVAVLPHADRLPFGVGAWLVDTPPGRLLGGAFTLLAFAAVGYLLRAERRLVLAWALAIVLVPLGGWFSGFASERHLGHLYMVALALAWIAAAPGARSRRSPPDGGVPARLRAASGWIVTAVLLWHVAIGLAATALDLTRALAPWKAVLDVIEREVRAPYTLLTDYSYMVGPLLAYLDRPTYDVTCGCFTRHYEWSWRVSSERDALLVEAWCRASNAGERVVVVLGSDAFADDAWLRRLSDVPAGYRVSEKVPTIWTVSEAGRTRCAADAGSGGPRRARSP